MKKRYLLIFVSVMSALAQAQSLGKTVINSTGGNIGSTGGVKMLTSVGEPIAGMVETRHIGLSQGYITGTKALTTPNGINDLTTENATVYPTPFSKHIYINSVEDNIHIYVFNLVGQVVYDAPYASSGADLSELAPGAYVIHATSNDKTIINTKILKQ